MKSWYTIIDMLALFILAIMLNTTYHRMNIYEQEYNEQRLAKATEYATSAAFSESIGRVTDDMDYNDIIAVFLNNRNTLETFEDLMCFNYGLTRTTKSRQAVDDSVRTAMLAAEDGYYVLNMGKDNEDGTKIMWSPKLPYIYEGTVTRDPNNDNRKCVDTYAVNLQTENWSMVRITEGNGSTPKKQEYHSGKKYSDAFPSADKLTKIAQPEAISKTLTDALAYSADMNNADREGTELGTYIPSEQTLSGINSIKTPTIMFIMQSGDYTGELASDSIALTGIRTIHQIRTIGYRADDGRLKYSYEWQGAAKKYGESNIVYFDTQEDAARGGYVPDHEFLYNRIEYEGAGGDN